MTSKLISLLTKHTIYLTYEQKLLTTAYLMSILE